MSNLKKDIAKTKTRKDYFLDETQTKVLNILEQFGRDVTEVNKMQVGDNWTFKFSATYKSLHKARKLIKEAYDIKSKLIGGE